MRPREWVKSDTPWALFIHVWAIVDCDARVQADGPWMFRDSTGYCVTTFYEKACRCGLFELLDMFESPRVAELR